MLEAIAGVAQNGRVLLPAEDAHSITANGGKVMAAKGVGYDL